MKGRPSACRLLSEEWPRGIAFRRFVNNISWLKISSESRSASSGSFGVEGKNFSRFAKYDACWLSVARRCLKVDEIALKKREDTILLRLADLASFDYVLVTRLVEHLVHVKIFT